MILDIHSTMTLIAHFLLFQVFTQSLMVLIEFPNLILTRGAPYPHTQTFYNPTFTTRDNLQKKYLRNDNLKRNLMEMFASSNCNLYPTLRIGKKMKFLIMIYGRSNHLHPIKL